MLGSAAAFASKPLGKLNYSRRFIYDGYLRVDVTEITPLTAFFMRGSALDIIEKMTFPAHLLDFHYVRGAKVRPSRCCGRQN